MDFTAFNDSELVYLARCGVSKAQEVLQTKYDLYLRKWIQDIIVLQETDYNDYHQRAKLALQKGILSFRDEQGFFYTYLGIMVRHEVRTELRKYLISKETNYYISIDDSIKNPKLNSFILLKEGDSSLFTLLQADQIMKYLNQELPRLDQLVFLLLLQGYSYQEVADHLALKPKNVDNSYQRIKKFLQSQRNFFGGEIID